MPVLLLLRLVRKGNGVRTYTENPGSDDSGQSLHRVALPTGILCSQHHFLYSTVEEGFPEGWVYDRILCIPSSMYHMYFGNLMVDTSNSSMNTAQRMKGWGPDEVEVGLSIQRLARGQFAYFSFVRFVHMALHGVAYRGFADPGRYADRDEQVSLLGPLSENVFRIVDFAGLDFLLNDTNLSKLEI